MTRFPPKNMQMIWLVTKEIAVILLYQFLQARRELNL